MVLYKGINLDTPQPQAPTQTIPQPAQKKLFSGGLLSDVADTLNVGQYAVAGAARNVLGLDKDRSLLESVKEGVNQRASFVDVIKEKTPYEASTSVFRNFLNEFVRMGAGIAADIVLDPTFVLGKMGLIKKTTDLAKTGVKTAGKALYEASPELAKMTDKIAPWVVRPSKLLPEYYTQEKTLHKAINAMTDSEIGKLDQFLTAQKYTQEEQIKLAKMLEGELEMTGGMGRVAKRMREEFDRVYSALAKENPALVDEKMLVKAQEGNYLTRLYKQHELVEDAGPKFGFRENKISGKTLKQRVIPKDKYIEAGGIPEAQPRILKGLFSETRDLNTSRFYNRVAKQVESNVPQSMGPGRVYLDPTDPAFSKSKIGNLSGKYVTEQIMNDLVAMGKVNDPLVENYLKALRYWKIGKTALNPATMSRNIMSAFGFQAPLAGVPPWRLDVYWNWIKEVRTNSPLYTKARMLGLEGSTYSATDLQKSVTSFYRDNPNLFQKIGMKVNEVVDMAANFYGNTDKFFKGAAFYKGVVHDGLDPLSAMRKAQFYLIDYSDIPKAVDLLRKSPIGAPFISFAYGISLPMAKTLLERPDKLAAYFKVMRGLQKINMDGRTESDIQKEEDALPGWAKKGRETLVRLPWKDGKGKSQYLDLGYILPLDVTKTAKGFQPLQGPLGGIMDITRNHNSFLDKKIWEDTDTQGEKLTKIVGHLIPNLLPNNPLVPGSFSYQKWSQIGAAPRISEGKIIIEPTKDKQGDSDEVLRTLLNTLIGVKVQPWDISEEAKKRFNEQKFDLRDLKSEITRIQKDKQLTDYEKISKIKKIQDKIRERTKK